MAELDHWHPVLRSEEATTTPRAVCVAGEELVVFRTESGSLGALPDACPHRGARLSEGRVAGEQLVCAYHGWQWATDGRGHAPGTPTAKPCARAFDVVERAGVVWVKRAGIAAAFPRFDTEGLHPISRTRYVADAPLELVLDNFIEVEHTPSVHLILGYPAERMHEVEHRTTLQPDAVNVFNLGPQRPLPSALYALLGIPVGSWFVDEWSTRFSPVYTVYDQYFVDPVTRNRVSDLIRIGVYFNPISAAKTELFVLAYTTASPWGRLGWNLLRHWMLDAFVRVEVSRDCRFVGRLADKRTEIKGNPLGRFDKALIASRERIARIYRGVERHETRKNAVEWQHE